MTRLLVAGFVAVLAAGAAQAVETRVFYAVLVGTEEAPPNESTARGTASAGLNDDDTLTYSVTSTGFETEFRAAHFHIAPPGVAGPIIFPIECNEEGTRCSGTSPRLDQTLRDALSAGETYVNLHTDAFPGGEIRGQVFSVAQAPPPLEAPLMKLDGRAKDVGKAPDFERKRGAEIRIKGRIQATAAVDLRESTAVIGDLLDEVGGAGELVMSSTGLPTLPMPMMLVKGDRRGKEAVYEAVPGGTDPACRLKVKKRNDEGLFEFDLECKRRAGASIPNPPLLCSGGRRPRTMLRTRIVINNAGTPLRAAMELPWRCEMRRGAVRALKALSFKASDRSRDGENDPPKADFRAEPRSGPAPLTVTFDNRSEDRNGDALTYTWDFGDGTMGTATHPTHTYEEPGEYEVRLLVTDAHGASSSPKRGDIKVREPE